MAMKQLYINGIGTGTYGIYISSDTYLNAPAPDYFAHQVPGRSGDLLQWNKRLNNIARKFTCYIPDQAQSNMDGFKKLLYSSTGYLEISSDYEPDTYQRGYLAEEIDAEPFQSEDVLRVTFDVIFSCEPQKYYKTNTSETIQFASNTPMQSFLFPRSRKSISQLFQMIPVSDVPNGDAFVMLYITPSAYPSAKTFSNAHATMTGYDGFMAIVVGETMYAEALNSNVKSVVGCTYNGAIDDSSYSYTSPDGGYGAAVVLPADAVGTLTASIDVDGVTLSISVNLQSMGDISNADAIGGGYSLTINGTYGKPTQGTGADEDAIAIYMGGSLNGEPTFGALLTVDTSVFGNLATSGVEYPTAITIDSDGLTASAVFDGETMNISDNVGIFGSMSGLADRIDLYVYSFRQSVRDISPFFYADFEISPRWWKI